MSRDVYRYRIAPEVSFTEIEEALVLAIVNCESLHGASQTRLDGAHYMEVAERSLVIDATTDVGRTLNRLFIGYLQREFGPDSFQVERVSERPLTETASLAPAR